jgi:hypothetical protein
VTPGELSACHPDAQVVAASSFYVGGAIHPDEFPAENYPVIPVMAHEFQLRRISMRTNPALDFPK